jgi:NAD(P) transhydrogenase
MTGTIPSKTLREAVLHLTGLSQRGIYGQSYRVKEEITIEDLRGRALDVIRQETDVIRDQLGRNHVALVEGSARFTDPHTVEVIADGARRQVSGEHVVIASGTKPSRPTTVAFDERTIFDSDGLINIDRIPPSLVVVGAGVVGIEYASIFAALGTKVTVIDMRHRLLEFCDGEIVEGLQHSLRDLGVMFRLGETVAAVEALDQGALVLTESGKRIAADAVLYSAGRQGATDELDLDTAGLTRPHPGWDGLPQRRAPHLRRG